jgi:seryl-tRNA synthetase
MITTKYVREHIDEIRLSLKNRGSKFPLDELLKLDEDWRKQLAKLQEMQSKRNKASFEISDAKKKGEKIDEKIGALAELKGQIEDMENEIAQYDEKINELLFSVPNVLDKSVPIGDPPAANKVLREWGTIKERSGAVSHEDILLKLKLLDVERAAKIAGARFFFLKGDLAMLEQALIRFSLDELVKKGYMVIAPPLMLRKKYYRGVTALGDFEDMLYKIGDPKEVENKKDYEKMNEELFMIGTSEHAIAAMHAEEIFSGSELPLKYVGISPCFRREAGAHGRDTKGIFRVHQFYKVEQFIFSKPEDSWTYFDELVKNEEELFQKLNIPYHVIDICTGDIGTVAAKKIDIEAWMPSQKAYREVTSASNCTDWQSLRLDIKYDEKGERKYVHTLNATAIATNRTLVAIVENYVNADGTITVPDVLVPYMGKSKIE